MAQDDKSGNTGCLVFLIPIIVMDLIKSVRFYRNLAMTGDGAWYTSCWAVAAFIILQVIMSVWCIRYVLKSGDNN